MRKLKTPLLIMFGVCLSCAVYAIDMETLRNKLNYCSSVEKFKEAEKIARQNISLIDEVIFFSDLTSYNGTARGNAIEILQNCAEDGLISQQRYFDTLLRLLANINNVVNPKRLEMEKGFVKGHVASFGDERPAAVQYAGFSPMLNSLLSAGLIKNHGIMNSLSQKVEGAKAALDKGGQNAKDTAVNRIQAAINELDAQRGKHVTEDGYQIISGYCNLLIRRIQKP